MESCFNFGDILFSSIYGTLSNVIIYYVKKASIKKYQTSGVMKTTFTDHSIFKLNSNDNPPSQFEKAPNVQKF